jgi:hypothetical protein
MSPIYHLERLQQFAAVNILSDPGYVNEKKFIPNSCQVVIHWVMASGRLAHNVMYCSYSGTPPLSTAVANGIFNPMKTAFNAASGLATFMAPGTNLNAVSVLDFRTTTGTVFFSDVVAAPGTSSGTSLPEEVAAVLTARTANRGPSGRGRVYIPNLATNAIGASDTIAAGCVTALNNFATNGILPGLTTLGTPSIGLMHRQAYTSPITGAEFEERLAHLVPITQLSCKDNHFDSQRRRGLK